ncbi:dihydroorotate dehydrogenase [Buchnera aphidicola (Diuraphis noxia)]|uniref:Dihydroorotate dehydrogenase n=1 Tax=Buchnera aphidicola subsp. Diuraphis noxia TaxID=118101 RepID=A0A1B2H8Z1_BUCDN|nr:dihydroorotate dehydrogenase [Buchnera aphidicola (Diuraphis noxia)]
MFYYFIRKLLFLIDPEKSHTLTLKYLNCNKLQFLRDFFLNTIFHQKQFNVWD